ncbi:MAG: hypothetical protein MJE77_29425, partial [Proteobacteria bacterium]|nr:hypothetical protein [Pseudomonadota bacterium]
GYEPGVFRLFPSDEQGEALDLPYAEIELTPEEVGQYRPDGYGPGVIERMSNLLEQCFDSHRSTMAMVCDLLRAQSSAMAEQQRSSAEMMRVANETIRVANGVDALERTQPTPQVDVKQLAHTLADTLAVETASEQPAESWLNQFAKSPVFPMVVQLLQGFVQPIIATQQARMKAAAASAGSTEPSPRQQTQQSQPAPAPSPVPVSPRVAPASSQVAPASPQPAPASPQATTNSPIQPNPGQAEPTERVSPASPQSPEREVMPDDATCTSTLTTSLAEPALATPVRAQAPEVRTRDLTLPPDQTQETQISNCATQPTGGTEALPCTDQPYWVDPGLADISSETCDRSDGEQVQPAGAMHRDDREPDPPAKADPGSPGQAKLAPRVQSSPRIQPSAVEPINHVANKAPIAKNDSDEQEDGS